MPPVLGKASVGSEGLPHGCGGMGHQLNPLAAFSVMATCAQKAALSYWLAAHVWLHRIGHLANQLALCGCLPRSCMAGAGRSALNTAE